MLPLKAHFTTLQRPFPPTIESSSGHSISGAVSDFAQQQQSCNNNDDDDGIFTAPVRKK